MEQNGMTEFIVKKELIKTQIVVESQVRCDEHIHKVMGVDTLLTLSVSECLNGEVRLSGKLCYDVIYDGASGCRGVTELVEFSERVECDVNAHSKVKVRGKVLDTDIVSTADGIIKLASVVEITTYEMAGLQLPSPIMESGVYSNDMHTKSSSVASQFSVMTDIECDEMIKGGRIISVSARATTKSADAGIDSALVTGDIYFDVCVLIGDNMSMQELCCEYSEEVPANGSRVSDLVHTDVQVCKVSMVESESGYLLTATLCISGEVYCTLGADMVVDAFSPTHSLVVQSKNIELPYVKCVEYIGEQVEGSVPLDEGDSADNILAVSGFEFISENAYGSYGKACVDGAITGNIIYYDAESSESKSVNALIPVQICSNIPVDSDDLIVANGQLGNITVKIRRSGEIFLRADVRLGVIVIDKAVNSVVSGIDMGEPLVKTNAGISVYVASSGDTAYDCARRLAVSPETLISQNSELVFPLEKGQKVLVYRD